MSSETSAQLYRVSIEFKGIQDYILRSHDLLSMVGANTLLGETLRGRFNNDQFVPLLDEEITEDLALQYDNLPALARDAQADYRTVNAPQELTGVFGEFEGDPIEESALDDPGQTWPLGILARDGGHFEALFSNIEGAGIFLRKAALLINRKLPGLRFSSVVQEVDRQLELVDQTAIPQARGNGMASTGSIRLPQQQYCDSIEGEAADTITDSIDGTSHTSIAARLRQSAADRFSDQKSYDMLGLCSGAITTGLKDRFAKDLADKVDLVYPKEFNEITQGRPLAVIKADGNDVGNQSREFVQNSDQPQAVAREQFFHKNRFIVRLAIVNAIRLTFQGYVGQEVAKKTDRSQPQKKIEITLPFRLLMLGGDDLLLVCDAAFAPKLAVEFSRELEDLSKQHGRKPNLTFGIGISVVPQSFPFHQSHLLAEELVNSSKELAQRFQGQEACSTIDWLNVTAAWHDDLQSVRRDHQLIHQQIPVDTGDSETQLEEWTLILSERPYRVSTDGVAVNSFEGLWNLANQLVKDDIPRNQIRRLADSVSTGKLEVDWVLQATRNGVPEALSDIITQNKRNESKINSDESKAQDGGESIWNSDPINKFATTKMVDLTELYEIARLFKAATGKVDEDAVEKRETTPSF